MKPIDKVFQIFQAGTHTAMNGNRLLFTREQLESLAFAYPGKGRMAPLTLGHPKNDRPVLGEVKRLFMKGQKLYAHAAVSETLINLVREGRYRNRSAAFYFPGHPDSPTPETWGLRHIGFLGAVGPAVHGMEALNFASELDGCACIGTDCDFSNCSPHEDLYQFAAPPGYQVDTTEMPLYRLTQEYRRGCPELSFTEAGILAAPYVTN